MIQDEDKIDELLVKFSDFTQEIKTIQTLIMITLRAVSWLIYLNLVFNYRQHNLLPLCVY